MVPYCQQFFAAVVPRLIPLRLTKGKQLMIRQFTRISSSLTAKHENAVETEESEQYNTGKSATNRRINPLGIQMLSKTLHRQIFGDFEPAFSRKAINRSKKHLKDHGLLGKEGSMLPDIDVDLPKMIGNLNEHFNVISRMQSMPYINLAQELATTTLPPMSEEWKFEEGWIKYDHKKGTATKVACPEDAVLIFNAKTKRQRPVIATAVSPSYWYSWVSRHLISREDVFNEIKHRNFPDDLIPLESVEGSMEPISGSWQERLVVGHNVSYDRARVKEQYLISGPKTKFLDTLSLHVCVAGQTKHQKKSWLSAFKAGKFNNDENRCNPLWKNVSSPNKLEDVHWLYTSQRIERRPYVIGSLQDIRKDFQYCARDVFYTHEVLQKVLPLFLKRCPHPVTLAGMLEMGSAYLPVNHSWEQYLDNAEYKYKETRDIMRAKLKAVADDACSYMHNKRYEKNPWLCNLDWSIKKFQGPRKARTSLKMVNYVLACVEKRQCQEEEGFKFIISSRKPSTFLTRLPSVHMPGYPEWYRSLCMKRSDPNWCPGAVKIKAQTRVTPYLLRMKWKGHPLYYHSKLGWGYIISPNLKPGEVPNFGKEGILNLGPHFEPQLTDKVGSTVRENKMSRSTQNTKLNPKRRWKRRHTRYEEEETAWGLTDDVVTLSNGEQYYYFKLPNKGVRRKSAVYINPLSKHYLPEMEDGTLTCGAGNLCQEIATLDRTMSFWHWAGATILRHFVVWFDNDKEGDETISFEQSSNLMGAILPIVKVAGTVTRRANGSRSSWLFAPRPEEEIIGSEQKAMIRAPPGYHFVGADVDSQELWIAAVLGDMHFAGIHGSTPIGWMTVQGKKSDGTDVHSITAKTLGVSRDHAKILVYGRLYGAGKPFIESFLAKFNPSLSNREVKEKTRWLFATTKGNRMYKLTRKHFRIAKEIGITFHSDCVDDAYWRMIPKTKFERSRSRNRIWVGGSWSNLFNKLESIAMSDHPKTPVLQCSMSRALQKDISMDYKPTKTHWVVQSSAVDYLHLMLVFNRWLFNEYNIDGRFCSSLHDEVRYLVKSEDRYRAALALQYSNLFTRAMFAHQLKMYDLPLSVAFFSAVDIDVVLRKEATMDCKTPSNPLGLEKGHNIPFGETLDIYQILGKTNGSLLK